MQNIGSASNAAPYSNRFANLLSGNRDGSFQAPWDELLHQDNKVVLCPTLGSFLPFWYLLIPRENSLNFREWEAMQANRCVQSEVDNIVRRLFGDDQSYIWFEHGPSKQGSITGCGVDYAHIHIILDARFTVIDLLRAAHQFGVRDWRHYNSKESYSFITEEMEYLTFGDAENAYIKNISSPVGTQFFRRVIASLNGSREDWDYKKYPHTENVKLSIDRVHKRLSRQ